MRDIDNDIRNSLERLTDPHGDTPGTEALWGDLVARRQNRRNRKRALAALPLLLVAVLAVGIFSTRGSGDARSDVAAVDGDRSGAPDDFAPFEMTYRTLSYQGGQMVSSTWKLTYQSWTDWETTLVDGGPGVAEEPGFRRALSDGTLTEFNPDGTVRLDERVDGRLAPLALMSKGPRTGKAEGGDSDSTYRHEYTSTQEHECPDDPADGAPYCEHPGGTVVVETVEAFNEDGVPVFAEERIADSGRVLWQFETLMYERLDTVDEAATGTLRVRNIQLFGNGPRAGGTERAVIVFNEAIPVTDVPYVADITSADTASGMAWTTQGPNSTHVCASRHSVPEGAVGSVDLLIPARWFADSGAHTVTELATTGNPAKFPICGPYNGFIQYAMWSPLSADPADVTVTISADRTTVTVEVVSEGDVPLDTAAGQGVVADFFDRFREGDFEGAAALWTGYPAFQPDQPISERVQYIELLAEYPPFARILNSGTTTTFVTPSLDDDNGQVVTILDARSTNSSPVAVAFLTELRAGDGDERMWIQRLPPTDANATPELPDDGYVQPGQRVVVPGLPIEGGVRGFVNGDEVPVEADLENETLTVVVPPGASGDIAVTFVVATPEHPIVRTFAATVR